MDLGALIKQTPFGRNTRLDLILVSFAAVLCVVVFYIDTFTDIESAIAVLYVLVLMLMSPILSKAGINLLTAVCTFLTLLAFALDHGVATDLSVLLRLAVALSALYVACALLLKNESNQSALSQINSELRKSEFRYRSIFEQSRIALWERDYSELRRYLDDLRQQGVEDLYAYARETPCVVLRGIGLVRTVAANDAAMELVGKDPSVPISELEHGFIPPDDDTFLDLMNTIFEGRRNFEGKGTIRKNGEEVRHVLMSLTFPEKDGDFTRVIVGMVDITQREQMEDALSEARATLTEAVKASAIGAMSASLAHELNQPLGAVIVNAQTLVRWLAKSPPDIDSATRTADRILRDARRAGEIVRNTRQRLQQQPQIHAPFCPVVMARETCALLEYELRSARVAAEIRVQQRVPNIVGPRLEVQQVLINLVTNSIQALAESDVERRCVVVDIDLVEGYVVMSVIDNGPGIADKIREKLFTPFQTTKRGGVGIGLSICRSVMEGMGGSLKLLTDVELGTGFQMRLPLKVLDGS